MHLNINNIVKYILKLNFTANLATLVGTIRMLHLIPRRTLLTQIGKLHLSNLNLKYEDQLTEEQD